MLEKLRAGEAIAGKNKEVYEQGFVAILKQLHDEIDAAVADAYGWPVDLPEEDLLFRLVALNAERAEEERRGLIRWLRPDYQNPEGKQPEARETTDALALADAPEKIGKPAWPAYPARSDRRRQRGPTGAGRGIPGTGRPALQTGPRQDRRTAPRNPRCAWSGAQAGGWAVRQLASGLALEDAV